MMQQRVVALSQKIVCCEDSLRIEDLLSKVKCYCVEVPA